MNPNDADLNAPVSLAPFGENVQRAIIGWCLENPQFLLKCRSSIEPGWFTNILHQDLMRIIFKIYDTKRGVAASDRVPKVGEIQGELNMMFPSPRDLNARLSEIPLCTTNAKAHSFAWLSAHMTGWIRMIRLKFLLEDAKKQFGKKEFDRCIDWVDEKIHDVKKSSFMEDMYVSFENPIEFLREQGKVMDADCCTFGHHEMDELIKKGSKHTGKTPEQATINVLGRTVFNVTVLTRGSLMPGDMTVLMGPTNSGKTTTVLTMAIQNLLMGKYVGLITHEQDGGQIKQKIYAAIMRMAVNDLTLKVPNDPEACRQLEALNNLLMERLKFVHYAVPGKMFIEEVVPIIEQMQEDVSIYRNNHPDPAQRSNKGLDLLIWDYPAKLKSKALGRGSAVWDEKTYVYNEALNLGQTYGFHVLAPVQTNRQGFRVGRGDSQDGRPVDVDDVAEGFGIVTIAANVITINRPDDYKSRGLIRFHIAKCRSNETGWSLIVPTRFDQSIAYDLSKMSKSIAPGQDVSLQELISSFGLSPNAPPEVQAAAQQSPAPAVQPSPEVPPGQPVAPTAPATGTVVS